MAKEIIPTQPQPPAVPAKVEDSVRTLPLEEAARLVRKVSKDHEGLLRRLAK